VAIPLVQQAIAGVLNASPPALLGLAAAGGALLLLIGLWTPVASVLVAVAELGLAWLHPAERWTFVQFGTLSAALALLGPGGWSVDARLFGRKHIQIPQP
jgi:putative oxidoreductase